MANPFSGFLSNFGMDPSAGYDTAAAGAKAAQADAAKLSDLQWQRQMAGLQQAQGYTNQLQQLYNSIYSPGGGAPAAGGLSSLAPMAGGGQGGGASMLMGPPTQPGPARQQTQLEKDYPHLMPGASIKELNNGQYMRAAMDLEPLIPTAQYAYNKIKSWF